MGWQELPAGRELDRYTAQLRGWQVQEIAAGRRTVSQLRRPDGSFVDTFNTSELAWQQVPAYSTAIAAALNLVDDGCAFTLRQVPHNAKAEQHWAASFDGAEEMTAATPAEAVCRAWLARQDTT